MDLATLVMAAVLTSVSLIVFSLGLGSTQEDALSLLRRPRRLVRSLLSMNVVMPLVAAGLAAVFDFPRALNISLVALAVSPVPPILPKRQLEAGGRASYAVGLLMAAALLAIVFIPLALRLIALGFGKEAHVPEARVAGLVAITVLVPIAAGIVVRRLAPAFAARASRPISLGAMALLGVAVVLLLIRAWRPAVSLIGDGHLLALAAFVAIGLIVGHLLGGSDPRTAWCSRSRPRPGIGRGARDRHRQLPAGDEGHGGDPVVPPHQRDRRGRVSGVVAPPVRGRRQRGEDLTGGELAGSARCREGGPPPTIRLWSHCPGG